MNGKRELRYKVSRRTRATPGPACWPPVSPWHEADIHPGAEEVTGTLCAGSRKYLSFFTRSQRMYSRWFMTILATISLGSAVALAAERAPAASGDWPGWRGPERT